MITAVITSNNEGYKIGQGISVLNCEAEVKVLEYLKTDDCSTIKITAVGEEDGKKCVYHIIARNVMMVIEKECMLDNIQKKE